MKNFINIKKIKFTLIILSILVGLILFTPGNNKKEIKVNFETPKITYNSYKKFSHFPKILFAITFFYKFDKGTWIIPQKCNFFNFIKHIYYNKAINLNRKMVFIEGTNAKEIIEKLNESPDLSGDIITNLEEGSIFPDTYFFQKGISRKRMIRILENHTQKKLKKLWAKRKENFSLTFEEWIILASIVQKEAPVKEEMQKIASCFLTRMQKKMRLESCATVLYSFPKTKTNVTLKDRYLKTTHNTYLIRTLPPTAICMPGEDALTAVLEANNNYEYIFFYYCKKKLFLAKNFKAHIQNKLNCKIMIKKTRNLN